MKDNRLAQTFRTLRGLASMLALIAASTGLVAAAENSNPRVIPPQSRPAGSTYGEWSAKWWKWALENTTANNPLIDATGANCAKGQSGPVWFLAGTFGGSPVVRSCSVPAEKLLFFPVANAFCSADFDPPDFAKEQQCAVQLALATDLHAEVDGVPIQNLNQYFVLQSPNFELVLPPGNIFDVPAGAYSPSASAGVHLMLSALPAGSHVIHFHAQLQDNSVVDVTYYLVVK